MTTTPTATTLVLPTPASALHQWEGKPVPWITRWSGEVSNDRVTVSFMPGTKTLSLDYPDGRENREASGLLWKREGLSRKGKPEFAQINTYRQRSAMNKRLCQVCGSRINDRVITWLMSKESFDPVDGGALTMSAPTCASCVPLAMDMCPHLKAGNSMVARVLEYEPWGVFGDMVTNDPENPQRIKQIGGVMVEYAAPGINLMAVLAKQQVVKLTKFVIEES